MNTKYNKDFFDSIFHRIGKVHAFLMYQKSADEEENFELNSMTSYLIEVMDSLNSLMHDIVLDERNSIPIDLQLFRTILVRHERDIILLKDRINKEFDLEKDCLVEKTTEKFDLRKVLKIGGIYKAKNGEFLCLIGINKNGDLPFLFLRSRDDSTRFHLQDGSYGHEGEQGWSLDLNQFENETALAIDSDRIEYLKEWGGGE